jgi:pimeloyl-[acyl-carrier protein] methyl ester esterase
MIHVDELGSGREVVLLHGTPTAPAHMRPLAERLARSRRVILVHLPGYGRSPPVRPYVLDAVHALVEDALCARGVTTADLVGFSYGGYRAAALACRGRLRARSIVSLAGYADLAAADRVALSPLLTLIRQRADLAPVCEEFMLSRRGRADAAAVADVRSWASAVAPDDLLAEAEAVLASPDLRPRLAELDVPVLARVGAADVASPPSRSERLAAAAPRGELEVVPGVGHAILREDFEATAASIERHLQRAAG